MGTGQVVTPAARGLMEAECAGGSTLIFLDSSLGGQRANLPGHGKMGRDSQESC